MAALGKSRCVSSNESNKDGARRGSQVPALQITELDGVSRF